MLSVTASLQRRPAFRAKAAAPPRIVVAGNGMASHRLCRRLAEGMSRLTGTARPSITVVGEEPLPAYDRVHLTDCFSRRSPEDLLLAPEDWYRAQGIRLLLGEAVESIDAERRLAATRAGLELPYDHLVLATGSRPFVPPIPGADLPGVFTYRTLADLRAILTHAAGRKRAAVVGGGLLGLEAARALLEQGMRVTVLENSRCLMSRQLDARAAAILHRKLEAMGMEIHVQRNLARIARCGASLLLEIAEGGTLEADILILAAGVRPRDELAATCGLKTGLRGGFAVDDLLRTSLEGVYAIGECAVHRGVGYGLAAPGFRMAECLADTLLGRPRAFTGADQSTTLKVMGVEVHVLGDPLAEGQEAVCMDGDSGGDVYRHLTLRRGRLVGAIAVGAWDEAERVRDAALRNRRLYGWQLRRFARGGRLWAAPRDSTPQAWPDAALVCHCNQVRKGAICASIRAGCADIDSVRKATGASAVCGGCVPVVERLLGAPATPASRGLPATAIAAAALAALFALVPPLPSAGSVQSAWHPVERLWRDGAWHQATGYALLGLVLLALLLPLRKRLPFLRGGSLPVWKLAHALLGTAGVMALVSHTGLRLGHGLNLALSASFLALNLFGAFAAGALAWMERAPSPSASAMRTWLAWGHVLLFWPLPLLLAFHVWSVYLF
jgi:nitrite reductase (NADH) large subunit